MIQRTHVSAKRRREPGAPGIRLQHFALKQGPDAYCSLREASKTVPFRIEKLLVTFFNLATSNLPTALIVRRRLEENACQHLHRTFVLRFAN